MRRYGTWSDAIDATRYALERVMRTYRSNA